MPLPAIDVLLFVRWLLCLPLRIRGVSVTDRQLIESARLIYWLGLNARDEKCRAEMVGIAHLVAQMTIRAGRGRVANAKDCIGVLDKLYGTWSAPMFGLDVSSLKRASDHIKSHDKGTIDGVRAGYRSYGTRGEYAAEDGSLRVGGLKPERSPKDDLGPRIQTAWSALVEAKCPSPQAVLAKELDDCGHGPGWTSQRVNARIQRSLRVRWPDCPWKNSFWARNSGSDETAVPKTQPFVFVWKASKTRNKSTGLRVGRRR